MTLFLGIDGGGTKTEAALCEAPAFVERGRGTGGAGNITMNAPALLHESLSHAVAEAFSSAGLEKDTHVEAVCGAVAGYSVEESRTVFEAILRDTVNAHHYFLVPDYEAAYWGATKGEPGIVVIAGTGAVSFGRNAAGESQRFDGLGYLLGDRGSGFNLGLYGLRHALDCLQLGKPDALAERILTHIGATLPAEALRWLYGEFQPAKVAGIAPIVGEFAQAGSPVARDMVAEMARRLRHSVRQIRYGLRLPPECPVYPMGGLWNLGTFLQEEFESPHWRGTPEHPFETETLHGGRFVLATPKHDAATGAALIAQTRTALERRN